LVLGNEAADADSIVSAMCLAYLRDSAQAGESGDSTSSGTDESSSQASIFVPVATVDRSLVHLRRDVQQLLLKVGLGLEDIICMSDLSVEKLKENNNVKIILVDQNTVPSCVTSCGDATVEIIDHHLDAGFSPWVSGAKRNIAYDPVTSRALVGSSCTLVAENYLASGYITEEIAILLLGVIALDTFNMDPTINKGTGRDAEAMAALEALAPAVDKTDLFVLLRDAKLDISFWRSLSGGEAMQLDYKLFLSRNGCRTGIASILLPVEEFMAKDRIGTDIMYTFRKEKLDLFVVMALIMLPEGTKRELLCFSTSADSAKYLASYLTSVEECGAAGLKLRQKPATFPGGFVATVFDQQNVAYSRKQM
ncbi:unnamed protein product, partial [Ectocarpus fasciculatus]